MSASITLSEANPPIVALSAFCRAAGISPITSWRFRKRGWLTTVNIAGRQYCTSEAIAEFKRRAEAGEFARKHTVPVRVPGGAA